MSILSGRPQGCVVVHQDYGSVIVIHREEVIRVDKDGHYGVDLRLKHCNSMIEIHITPGEARDDVFDSIVSESVDVIWTKGRDGWLRTPDKEALRGNT